jgi:entericidin B
MFLHLGGIMNIKKTIWTLMTAFILGASMLTLTACHTTEGAGKDIEKTGDAIEDAAHDATH